MFTYLTGLLKKIGHHMSGVSWFARAFGLRIHVPEGHEPGLVMIQIDGLSYDALQRAIARNEMPFLQRLFWKEGYRIRHHYSGIPSSTPAVQGELFYGVKQCVPAFKYLDFESKEVFLFFYPGNAAKVEERLARQDPGLLQGGSSYGNIFSGGAAESHFCVGSIGARSYWKTLSPYSYLIAIFFNPFSLIKALLVGLYELFKTFSELFRGILDWHDAVEEVATIPVRIFVSIFLHDFITLGARIDIARGLPVISLNFFAYDELAHRYGAETFLAKRALAAVDRSIRKIWKTANHSLARDYELWIYSDHGQENTLPYRLVTGVPVEKAVSEVYREFVPEEIQAGHAAPDSLKGAGGARTKQWRLRRRPGMPEVFGEKRVIVTAQGPLGFVYSPVEIASDVTEKIAEALVKKARIPLVLARDPQGQVYARTPEGRFALPEDGGRIFGKDHPYLETVTQEMVRLCKSLEKNALVISGWRQNAQPISFPLEWASHGGPGVSETDGFVFLPLDATLGLPDPLCVFRPMDLRNAAKNFRDPKKRESSYRVVPRRSKDRPFRVMSYNVHSCIGTDRRLSAARIAQVIARHRPDVVALQELEHYGQHPTKIHQPDRIAKFLDMTYHFHPAARVDELHFGEAIFSCHPMRLVQAALLPGVSFLEPRGALWVEIDFFGQKIQLINTHLSLLGPERTMQINALLGAGWLGHSACRGTTVFCGDMNALPWERHSRIMRERFRDVCLSSPAPKPAKTWISTLPVARIDYIYVSPDIRVVDAGVPRMALERIASDHLPVIADLAF